MSVFKNNKSSFKSLINVLKYNSKSVKKKKKNSRPHFQINFRKKILK